MKNHKILPLFTLIIDQRVDNQIILPLFWNSLILNYFVGQNNHSGLVSFFYYCFSLIKNRVARKYTFFIFISINAYKIANIKKYALH